MYGRYLLFSKKSGHRDAIVKVSVVFGLFDIGVQFQMYGGVVNCISYSCTDSVKLLPIDYEFYRYRNHICQNDN